MQTSERYLRRRKAMVAVCVVSLLGATGVFGSSENASAANAVSELIMPFTYPVTGTVGIRASGGHDGYDVRGYGGIGAPVYASFSGRVTFKSGASSACTAVGTGYGRVLYVGHGNNLETRYAHLNSYAPGIAEGQNVSTGQLIGYMGNSGASAQPICDPHVHWEFKNVATGVWMNVNAQMAGVPLSGPVTAQSPIGFSGSWNIRPDLSAAGKTVNFGLPGDIPVTGDWNGDGYDTLGVVRYNTVTGALDWYLSDTKLTQVVNGGYAGPFTTQPWGCSGDTPVVGRWNGIGGDKKGVFRRVADANAGAAWLLDGAPAWNFNWGTSYDMPVPGDWNCDGTDSPGVARNNGGGNLQWWLDNQFATAEDYTPFLFGLSYPNFQDRANSMQSNAPNYSCSFPTVVREGAFQWFVATNFSGGYVGHLWWGSGASDYPIPLDWDTDNADEFGAGI
jgi:murein DD-endopeptidase MepM/ murein hydrolase activator NlpD